MGNFSNLLLCKQLVLAHLRVKRANKFVMSFRSNTEFPLDFRVEEPSGVVVLECLPYFPGIAFNIRELVNDGSASHLVKCNTNITHFFQLPKAAYLLVQLLIMRIHASQSFRIPSLH